METKHKTLAECKNQVLQKHNWSKGMTWIDFIEVCKKDELWISFEEMSDEAAELYASEENRKKDELKQSDVEQAANDYAADYSNPHNHKKDLKFSESDIFYIRQSTFKDAIKWQSQQPASVAWLTDSEIDALALHYGNEYRSMIDFANGFKMAQTELRKRVIDLNDFAGWLFGGHDKNVEESIVNDYINSKTK